MSTFVKMDRVGRVVIPRRMREKYGLVDGTFRLEAVESVEGIILRPSLETVPVERHASGWMVFGSSEEETVDPTAAVEEARERRDRVVRGAG